jgi:FkbM family methyltransferase
MNKMLKIIILIYRKLPFLSKLWNSISDKLLLPVTVEGRKIRVFKGHWAAILFGTYEKETIKMFKSLISKDTLFMDVGANVGLFSSIAISRGAKVLAFEPHPHIRNILKENLSGNNIEIYEYAASDKEEEVKLFISKEPGSHSLKLEGGKYILVKSLMIDSLISKKVNLVKIDVEGAELKAIKGMRKILENHKPDLIIEVDEEHLGRFGESLDSLKTLLGVYGYSSKKIGFGKNYFFSVKNKH